MPDRTPQTSLAAARAVAVGILFSMCAMTALGAAIAKGVVPTGGPVLAAEQARPIRIVFLAVGFGTIALSHAVRSALDRRAATSADPVAARRAAMIVGMALGETPATLGLVNGILTQDLTTTLLLGAAAIVTGLSHFPRGKSL